MKKNSQKNLTSPPTFPVGSFYERSLPACFGTSATVQPAVSLPVIAREHGAFLVEINPEPTLSYADLRLPEKAGQAMTSMLAALS
jgi:NAD-dependent SIR2 family protein deacetylase